MSVIGVTIVRDEADVIGSVVRHMLTQCDAVIVADNLSSDGTRQILDAVEDPRLTVLDDLDPAYEQSRKMTTLAEVAADMGAAWVVPFDADEIWLSRLGRIADVLPTVGVPAIAPAPIFNHWATGHDDQPEADPFRRLRWRWTDPLPLFKVAVTTSPRLRIHMGNHGADYGAEPVARIDGLLEVRHFPYRDPDQFVRKAVQGAAALRLADLPEGAGAHWRQYADLAASEGPQALADWWRRYFYHPDPTSGVQPDPDQAHQRMVYDQVPL